MSINDYTLTVGEQHFEVVVEVGEYSYDWSVTALLRDVDTGSLYVVNDSGCSCNYFGDSLVPGDLVPVANWQEGIDKIRDRRGDEAAAEAAAEILAWERSQ